MKLCIFSDSHGRGDLVKKLPAADAYLFCGDGLGDLTGPVHAVAGNCDWGSKAPTELLLELGGRRILLTHGHRYRVKSDLYRLSLAAREQEAEVVCFGHTHQPCRLEEPGLLLLNPGSLGQNGSCLLLDTDSLQTEHCSII